MEETCRESETLKLVSDLPSNNGVEENENTSNKVVEAADNINLETNTIEKKEEKKIDDLDIDKMFKEAEENLTDKDMEVEITEEDLKAQIESDANQYFKNIDFDSEDIAQFLKVVKKVQNKEKFSIYKELPEKVKKGLDKYLAQAGMGGYSVQANTFRNDMAEIIIDEFIRNISLDKYNKDLDNEMAKIQKELDENISSIWKDYTDNRHEYISKLVADDTDEERKKSVGEVLDAMNDGFELKRMKEAAPRIRIKNYELENPKRAYDLLHTKYTSSTCKNNIYSIFKAHQVLEKHMIANHDISDRTDIARFFIAICKVCMNYNANSPKDHAFVYYALYNPLLLDIYKGEQYTEFYEKYKKNVLEVINLLKRKK